MFAFNLRFPGQYYDAETGKHYNYHRDYDSSLGRYIQSDPIGLSGGLNTYRYGYNSPLLYLDRLGLEACTALLTLRGRWNESLVDSTALSGNWSLSLVNVSLSQDTLTTGRRREVPLMPGGVVDCFAKYTVTYQDDFKRSRSVQTLEQCIDMTCDRANSRFVIKSYTEEQFYSKVRDSIEGTDHQKFSIASAVGILGQIKCNEWLRTLR